jgi:hypothetical protein
MKNRRNYATTSKQLDYTVPCTKYTGFSNDKTLRNIIREEIKNCNFYYLYEIITYIEYAPVQGWNEMHLPSEPYPEPLIKFRLRGCSKDDQKENCNARKSGDNQFP